MESIFLTTLVCLLGAAEPGPEAVVSPSNFLRPEMRWNLPWPDSSKPAAGYTVLEGVEHFEVFRGSPEQGEYAHHCQIAFHDGVFFATWSNHATPDEDSPGQRVLGSVSKDGRTWSPAMEVLPPIDVNEPRDKRASGQWRYLMANGFVTADCTVYCIADATDNKKGGFGRLAREMKPDTLLGEVFWLEEDQPEPLPGFRQYPNLSDPAFTKIAARINRILREPLQTRFVDFRYGTNKCLGLDGQPLCEPCVFQRPDGALVKIWRDYTRSKSKRLYVSVSADGAYWHPALQTNIPNSPSKAIAGSLPDGRTYLVGNLVTGHDKIKYDKRDPLVLALSWDGMNFDWAGAIRAGAPPLRFSTLRAPGFAYPSAVVANDALWVIYSIGKEDVGVSRVPFSAMNSPS